MNSFLFPLRSIKIEEHAETMMNTNTNNKNNTNNNNNNNNSMMMMMMTMMDHPYQNYNHYEHHLPYSHSETSLEEMFSHATLASRNKDSRSTVLHRTFSEDSCSQFSSASNTTDEEEADFSPLTFGVYMMDEDLLDSHAQHQQQQQQQQQQEGEEEEEEEEADEEDEYYQQNPKIEEETGDEDYECAEDEEEDEDFKLSTCSNNGNQQNHGNNNHGRNSSRSICSSNSQKRKKKNKKDCVDEHDIDTFSCGQCNRVYQYLSSLKSHCKSVHKSDAGWKGQYSNVISKKFAKNRDFACPMCDSSCASHYGLRRHMTTKHREDQKKLLLFYLIEDLCLKENSKHKDLILANDRDYVLKLKSKHLDELEQELECCSPTSPLMSEDQEEEKKVKVPKQKHTRGQGKWTESEKRNFLEGVKIYGKNNLHMIARFIKTKDAKQVEKFSNKYFSKLREGFQCLLGSATSSNSNASDATRNKPGNSSSSSLYTSASNLSSKATPAIKLPSAASLIASSINSDDEKLDSEDEEKVNDSEIEKDSSPRAIPIPMKRKRVKVQQDLRRKKIKSEFQSSTPLSDLLLEGPDLASTPPISNDFTLHCAQPNFGNVFPSSSQTEDVVLQQMQLRLQSLHQQHLLFQKQQQEEEEHGLRSDNVVELFDNMLFDESAHSGYSYPFGYTGCCKFIETE
jgi:hypothetical protein